MTVDIQRKSRHPEIPDDNRFHQWIEHALQNQNDKDVSLVIVDETQSRELNREYRQKDKPTNVLSFPTEFPEGVDIPLLGDIVICAPVVANEAAEQNKSLEAHWAHMTTHGVLHLLGYDHIEPEEAEIMESLETRLLTEQGFAAPYKEQAPES